MFKKSKKISTNQQRISKIRRVSRKTQLKGKMEEEKLR